MRVLIDSSVWIDHLRGVRSRETAILSGIARKRPRWLRITAPSSKARTICGALVYTRLAASSLWFG
jgi:hypothetical protein